MKKILLSGSVLLMLAGCGPANTPTNVTPPVNTVVTIPSVTSEETTQQTEETTVSTQAAKPENVCPAGQYSCACATGNYCLKIGAMCLNPSAACPAPASKTNTGDMQTYKNSAYRFQFDYPTTFSFTDANYGNLENKIVQIQLPSDAYPKTNFGDAAFTVSEATAKSLSECLAMNEPEGGSGFQQSMTVNGVKFYTTAGSGAGAGNYYETKNYRTFQSPECFEIAETIHTSNIGNYDPGTVTEINKTPIWTDLGNILSTFSFTQ